MMGSEDPETPVSTDFPGNSLPRMMLCFPRFNTIPATSIFNQWGAGRFRPTGQATRDVDREPDSMMGTKADLGDETTSGWCFQPL